MSPDTIPSDSAPLSTAAAVGSIFALTLGLAGTLQPALTFKLFDFAPPTNPEDRKLATNLCLFWGSRDLYMGVTALGAWYFGEWKSLGWMYLAAAGVAATDLVQSHRQLGVYAWKHGIAVPIAMVIGGSLLGWFN